MSKIPKKLTVALSTAIEEIKETFNAMVDAEHSPAMDDDLDAIAEILSGLEPSFEREYNHELTQQLANCIDREGTLLVRDFREFGKLFYSFIHRLVSLHGFLDDQQDGKVYLIASHLEKISQIRK